MRILHVVPTYWPAVRYGGPIRSVHGLASALAMRGHEVHVFTTNVDGDGESAVPVGRAVRKDGVDVTYFSSPLLRRLYWSPAMARALRRQMPSFDIVHLHSVFLWPTWAAARVASRTRVPYVLAPRGMLVRELIEGKSRRLKSAWIKLIELRTITRASALHVTSELEASDLRQFGWTLPRVVVIPNGVEEPADVEGQFISADVAAAISRGPFVLSLGRIVWKKGLSRLIVALPAIATARLVLAGDDPEDHASFLKKEAARLGVTDRVTIIARHVEGADKEALFGAAMVFAMPSLSENFGIAAVEAMRRGCPVFVTPEVGVADLVAKSGGGIVAGGEPAAIAEGLAFLLADAERSAAMGNAGQAFVSARYAWNAIAASAERLYQSILAEGGR